MGKLKLFALCGALVIIVVMPDVIVELLHGLLELLIAFGHTLFEIVEVTLDALIEHMFHTDLHQTQIIVFYILLLVGFYGVLRLWRATLGYCRRCTARWLIAKSFYKTKVTEYWQRIGSIKKLQIILLSLLFISGLFFLLLM